MKKYLLAAAAALAVAAPANALTLISAVVTGPSGTVWRTANAPIGSTSNYALFLATPNQAAFINPNNEAISVNVSNTSSVRYFLSGDGFPDGTTANSDPNYTLTLGFDSGQSLTGVYTTATNSFVGSTAITSGGQTIRIAEFSYNRFLGDTVSQFRAVPGGNGNDYNGNFLLTSTVSGAVPEPATWGMMLVGFGALGTVLRRRRRQGAQVTFA